MSRTPGPERRAGWGGTSPSRIGNDARLVRLFLAAVLAGLVVAGSLAPPAAADVQLRPYRVLILGDSYAAGNGTGDYYSTTGCYRSHEVWGELLATAQLSERAALADRSVEVTNRACGSAVLHNLRLPQVVKTKKLTNYGSPSQEAALELCRTNAFPQTEATIDGGRVEVQDRAEWIENTSGGVPSTIFKCYLTVPPQMDHVSDEYDLVVMTFGGNDAGFGEIAKKCLALFTRDVTACDDSLEAARRLVSSTSGNVVSGAASDNPRAGFGPRFRHYLPQIESRLNPPNRTADRGQVMLASYPHLIRNHNYDFDGVQAGQRLRQLQVDGDSVQHAEIDRIASEVETCRHTSAMFADEVKANFEGHEAVAPISTASEGWWVNGLDVPFPANALHPNIDGQWAMANAANAAAVAGGVHGRLGCPFTIRTTPLPDAQFGVAYDEKINTTSVYSVSSWAIESGSLPPGLLLDQLEGTITGTPTVPGSFTFSIHALSALGDWATRNYTLTVDGESGGPTQRVSVASDGTQADSASRAPAISGDGRYIAYYSAASNLVPGDTNDAQDVFLWDRSTGTTTLVSAASDGSPALGSSMAPAISPDGGHVAFDSSAPNLVPGGNGGRNVFVWDRATGTTTLVSVALDGTQANSASYHPAISIDGRFIAYYSLASNLVPDDTASRIDVFVWDRDSAATTRVSVALGGAEANGHSSSPSISGDGRYVAYKSQASNLAPGGNIGDAVFVWDYDSGATTRVSVSYAGSQANHWSLAPKISADGEHIAYESLASNLVPGDTVHGQSRVFIWDRGTGTTTTRASAAPGGAEPDSKSWHPAISSDGGHVAYESYAANLVSGDTNENADVFLWSR